MSLLLLSWNVRSLSGKDKREAVLHLIAKSKASVVFLQETGANERHCRAPNIWLGPNFAPIFDAFLTSKCAILIRRGTFRSIKLCHAEDRIVHLQAQTVSPWPYEFGDYTSDIVHLVCVYAPVNVIDRPEFFAQDNHWDTIPDDPTCHNDFTGTQASSALPPFTILAGDLNDFPDFSDSPLSDPRQILSQRVWYSAISPLLQRKGLVDPLRESVSLVGIPITADDLEDEPDIPIPHFLTRVSAKTATRIDHILLSRSLGMLFEPGPTAYYAEKNSTLSDHSQVFLTLSLPPATEVLTHQNNLRQPRIWTLHRAWCDNPIFLKELRKIDATQIVEEFPWARWKTLRDRIQFEAKKWSHILPPTSPAADQLDELIRDAGRRLNTLVKQNLTRSALFEETQTELSRLEHILLNNLRQAFHDSTNAIEELPRSWVCQRYKSRASPRIHSLLDEDGNLQRSWSDLSRIVESFFSKLYAAPQIDYTALNEVLHVGGRHHVLTTDQCRALRAPITEQEVKYSVSRMNDKSMPGQDGLPLALFGALPTLQKELSLYGSALLTSAAQAEPNTPNVIVSLLPKKGDPNDIRNKRPISLINIGDRILSSVFSNRLLSTKTIHSIVPSSQTAFVTGRSLTDSVLTIQLFISANLLGLTSKSQSMIFLDQEKAFDKLAPAFTYRALRHYGIPAPVIQFFKKARAEATSAYKLNGSLTDPIPIRCGVHQGDPVAPLLYCMGTQPFIDWMTVKGIAFRSQKHLDNTATDPEANEELRTAWPQYADDWVPVVSKDSASHLLSVTELMKRAANISVNEKKSTMLSLHPPTQPRAISTAYDTEIASILPLTPEAPDAEIRYLGAYIRADGQPALISHQALLAKARQHMSAWQALPCSWLGAVRIVNTFYTSKIWHCLGAAGGLDAQLISHEIYHSIGQIIFRGYRNFINLHTLAMPLRYGGLGLIVPRHMLPAMAGRDLAQGLRDPEHLGPLFRSCLQATSKAINEDEGIWLERRGEGWTSGRLTTFQPMWLRFAHAAVHLNLRADPDTLKREEALRLPWWTPSTDPNRIFTAQDRSWLRRGGLRSWADILQPMHRLQSRTISIVSLDTAINTLASPSMKHIDGTQKTTSRHAWKILHDKWGRFATTLPPQWIACLTKGPSGIQSAPRWMSEKPWPTITLPFEHLILADVPLQMYSISTGRKYVRRKEHHWRMIPHRLQSIRLPSIHPDAGEGAVPEEEDRDIEGDRDHNFMDHWRLADEEVTHTTNSLLNDSVSIFSEVNTFWEQLTDTHRILRLSPSLYTAIYAAYHGSLPLPLLNNEPTICCRGERGSRRHKLHACIRATAMWAHMNSAASTLGLSTASTDERECTELFPRWRSGNGDNHFQTLDTPSKTKAKHQHIKMLLITIHIHALRSFMTTPATLNTIKPAIEMARFTMATFPLFHFYLDSSRLAQR